jgi:hypothetical protein
MSKRPSTTDPSVTDDGDGDAFLSRWARRKRVARGGGDPDEAIVDTPGPEAARDPAEAPAAETASGDSQPAELGDEDMPPVERIDGETDMSGFFSPQVSRAVKKAALRKFFHSPAFNIVDGLDDYDDDFRNFEALGDIITSDMRGQMEREAEKAKEALAKDADAAPAPDDAQPVEVAEEAAEPGEEDAVEEEAAPEQTAAADDADVTREPGAPAGIAGGKLRPRGDDT